MTQAASEALRACPAGFSMQCSPYNGGPCGSPQEDGDHTAEAPPMPISAYRCPACQANFDVSRRLADRAAPAFCPADGAEGKRLMTAPNVGGHAIDPASVPKSAPAASKWSHFGHSHTGGGSHAHGAPAERPRSPRRPRRHRRRPNPRRKAAVHPRGILGGHGAHRTHRGATGQARGRECAQKS